MNCMKCGRDIDDGQVFCNCCLEVMEKYPVKPGIAVLLPPQKNPPGSKKTMTRRRSAAPEEQILRLKKRVRALLLLWLVTALLLAATIYPTVEFFLGKPFHLPGQNYSTFANEESTGPGLQIPD